MYHTLSQYVRIHPDALDVSLEKLTCISHRVQEVDIHPAMLSVLTEQASSSVQTLVKHYAAPSRQHNASGSNSAKKKKMEVDGNNNNSEGFNIAIALTVHTLLLSRNYLRTTLGLVQFKNVVRLSLLGNKIQRLENCEPLGLLPHLSYLSLEFNDVTSLPNYRPHILRICSWPSDLSPSTCRLRKLDAKNVTPKEVHASVVSLEQELVLMPGLLQRQRFLSFLGHVDNMRAVHQEMQKRGFLLISPGAPVQAHRVLERCSRAALDAVDVGEAAHMTRRFLSQQLKDMKRRKRSVDDGSSLCISCPSSLIALGDLDISVETRTSSDGSIAVLDNVSEILVDNLKWSQSSLRQAEHTLADAMTCEEWGKDLFRQAISWMDVRMCTLLLRIARSLGQSLTSQDVDTLCGIWMHQLTHHTDVLDEHVNVTGVRVPVVIKVQTGKTPVAHRFAVPHTPLPGVSPIRRRLYEEKDSPLTPVEAAGGEHLQHRLAEAETPVPAEPPVPRPREEAPIAASAVRPLASSTPVVVESNRKALTEISASAVPTLSPSPEECHFYQRVGVRRQRHVLQVWRTALFHRRQHAQCHAHVSYRVAMDAYPVSYTTASLVAAALPYHQRKGYYFHVWCRHARERQAARQFQMRCILGRWQRRARESRLSAATTQRRQEQTLRVTLDFWKKRIAARSRIRADSVKEQPLKVWRKSPSSTALRWGDEVVRGEALLPSKALLGVGPSMSPPSQPRGESEEGDTFGLSDGHQQSCSPSIPSPAPFNPSPISLLDTVLKSRPDPSLESPLASSLTLHPPPAMEHIAACTPPGRLQSSRRVMSRVVQFSGTPQNPWQQRPSQDRLFSIHRESQSPYIIHDTPVAPQTVAQHSDPHLQDTGEPLVVAEHDRMQHVCVEAGLPFSEDDVAALVAKASLLHAEKKGLVKRVVDLQVSCEEASVQRRCKEDEVESLKASIEELKSQDEVKSKTLSRQTMEIAHLRQCVDALRAERREWMDRHISQQQQQLAHMK